MNAAPCSWRVMTKRMGEPSKGVEQIHVLLARHAEDEFDAFVLQTFDDEFSGFHSLVVGVV
jgi:hypothetical protein